MNIMLNVICHSMQIRKKLTILINLKITDYDLSYNLGLWTVNKKSDKSVTLQSDFLEMSYE